MLSAHWDARYAAQQYAYGTEPNEFLKEQLQYIPVGMALFAAEGEGRNAVYASTLGWHTTAFDISTEGRKKALKLATVHNTGIDYIIATPDQIQFGPGTFDALILIYAHFDRAHRSVYHQKLSKMLKPGGRVILEAFSQRHLFYNEKNPAVGGPRDLNLLYDKAEITLDFPDFEILTCSDTDVELNEGICHKGTGAVIRFVAVKK